LPAAVLCLPVLCRLCCSLGNENWNFFNTSSQLRHLAALRQTSVEGLWFE
jgi:hypothetical protein